LIRAIFTDLGGVCLSNGWDSVTRRKAAKHFHLDFNEMEARHQMIAGIYEEGKLAIDVYLDFVVYHVDRPFHRNVFTQYMKDQSKPFPDMLELYREIKERHGTRMLALSNEGRELAEHRIATFNLPALMDIFVVSSFTGFRKPDPNIFKMALDMAQVAPEEIVYIDDRAMLVEAAGKMGLQCLWHRNYRSTKAALAKFGLGVGSK
jgi:putative hydrolase of the HAD superfamily